MSDENALLIRKSGAVASSVLRSATLWRAGGGRARPPLNGVRPLEICILSCRCDVRIDGADQSSRIEIQRYLSAQRTSDAPRRSKMMRANITDVGLLPNAVLKSDEREIRLVNPTFEKLAAGAAQKRLAA